MGFPTFCQMNQSDLCSKVPRLALMADHHVQLGASAFWVLGTIIVKGLREHFDLPEAQDLHGLCM